MTEVLTDNPLSAAQQQLLAGQLLAPEVPMCNMALACSIDGDVNEKVMVQAWTEVAQSYDALGLRIVIGKSDVTQSTGHVPPSIELIDFSQQDHSRQLAQEWMQQDVSTAIAPDGVLGRVALIKLAQMRWIFFCNLHHTICDATSFAVIWRRLASVYKRIEGTSSNTTDDNVSAADFLSFVQNTLQAQEARSKNKPDYVQQLQDTESPAPFGYRPDRDRANTSSTRVSVLLDDQRSASLAKLAALPQARGFGKGIGNCNVLLTVLVALLYRIGGGAMQTVGLPLPQRQDPIFRETVGLLVEVLPLQIAVDEHATFQSLLEQVRKCFLGLLKDAEAGDSSQLNSHSVPALLNYINAPLGDFGDLSSQVEWLHSGHIDSQHLIRLQVEDWSGDNQITLSFDFNDAVFNDIQRTQTIEAFWSLFDAMFEDLQNNVESVPVAKTRLLNDPSLVQNTPTQVRTVLARIEENCRQLDREPALVEGIRSQSYAQMGARVRQIALKLQSMGIGRGSRVAVYLHRNIDLPQVLLGIQASGAAYVPIDANQPVPRILEILSDAKPSVLVTNAELTSAITFGNKFLVDQLFDELPDNEVVAGKPSLSIDSPILSDTAYIIYTSGSTGVPKGVAITHESLANYCDWAMNFYARDAAVNMALITPIGFDLTVTSLFLPLMTGGTLSVYGELAFPGGEALNAVLKDDNVDIIKLTPGHLGMLSAEQCRHTSRLSQFIVGGEDLPTSLAARIDRQFEGRVRIHNEYGPTEATVGCVLHTYDAETDLNGSVPIGQPIAGCNVRVLNAAGQDALPGCNGELYVSGPSLAKGYWGRDDLTLERFTKLAPDGERYYRTGDLVREGRDGYLRCLGRADNQFKLRGHRIEPAEIESAALQHPALDACVAVLSSPQTVAKSADQKCLVCGLSSRVPGALLDESGKCHLCRNFSKYQERVEAYFRPMHELREIVIQVKENQHAQYDCIMLLSGGKDSSYALAQLVDMGLRVLAFTLDNGFISESAKENAARVCAALGVEHRYGSTPSMNAIFLDSLQRHANVCNGCFKTIYTMALQLAHELKINCIITGLSRGQFFETRLSEDWFMAPDYRVEAMDEAIVAARKAYHHIEDTVSCALKTDFLQDDAIFDRVQIVDFYRYCDVDLDEMYHYLDERLPWARPTDTGRSTNCLINDAGIYVHRYERGFHNYAHPYSWDVRLGHKQRDAALDELDDEIDEQLVLDHLGQIGYELSEKEPERLALYYVCNTDITQDEIRRWLAARLPEWMIPVWLIELPELPLSLNGKVDPRLLPVPSLAPVAAATNGVPRGFGVSPLIDHRNTGLLAPQNNEEQLLERIWCRHLRIESIGVTDNFFALGGDSLMAIRITSELNRAGHPYRPADIFEHQTIAQLAQIDLVSRQKKGSSESILTDANDQQQSAAFSSLSGGQLDALSRALGRKQSE